MTKLYRINLDNSPNGLNILTPRQTYHKIVMSVMRSEKDSNDMVYSVNLDQTAQKRVIWSRSTLFAQASLSACLA